MGDRFAYCAQSGYNCLGGVGMYKIMVVEDEEKIRILLRKELNKWGFDVCAAEDFTHIFEQFAQANPHLVLMDINLPAYDGFYWCNQIRTVSKVPVIFVSSRNSNMDVVMAVNMGGDDYITKPFSMEVLTAKINAVLRRAYSYHAQNSDTLECRGAVLTLKDNILRFNNHTAELTKNEFRILYTLMKQNGAIVSREQLMRALWDDESFIDDNTLTVNVNRLRKKTDEIGLNDFIKTVKNQGYRIG